MILIQQANEMLANLCLAKAEEHHNYSERDLLNASFIFSHFLIDLIWTHNQHLTVQELSELAEKTGEAIRELIKASTGLDMHEVTKNSMK